MTAGLCCCCPCTRRLRYPLIWVALLGDFQTSRGSVAAALAFCRLEHVYLRGNHIRFVVLPEILLNAPLFKFVDVTEGGRWRLGSPCPDTPCFPSLLQKGAGVRCSKGEAAEHWAGPRPRSRPGWPGWRWQRWWARRGGTWAMRPPVVGALEPTITSRGVGSAICSCAVAGGGRRCNRRSTHYASIHTGSARTCQWSIELRLSDRRVELKS